MKNRIQKAALCLSGYYSNYDRFDKLELIEIIRGYSPSSFTTDFFKIIDSQDFYLMCLNKVYRADYNNLEKILNILNV